MMDIKLRANLETKTTLGINKLLVPFDSGIRQPPNIESGRIPESGH
jgi:hypothetical protein